jgi:hypothetical protein
MGSQPYGQQRLSLPVSSTPIVVWPSFAEALSSTWSCERVLLRVRHQALQLQVEQPSNGPGFHRQLCGFRALRVPKAASCVRRELRRVESTHSCRLLGTRHRNAPQRSMKNTRMRRSSFRVLSELVGHVGRPNCETPTGACWPRSSARAGADRIVVWGSPSLYGDPSDRATQREVAQPLT